MISNPTGTEVWFAITNPVLALDTMDETIQKANKPATAKATNAKAMTARHLDESRTSVPDDAITGMGP